MSMKLRHRLLLLILLPLLLAAGSFYWVNTTINAAHLTEEAHHHARLELESEAYFVQHFFERHVYLMNTLAESHVFDAGNRDHIFHHLDQWQRGMPDVESLYLGDLKGNVYNSSGQHFDISDRPYLSAIKDGKTNVTTVTQSKESGRQIAIVTVPIRDKNGELSGALGATILVSHLLQRVRDFHDEMDSQAILFNDQGKGLAFPDGLSKRESEHLERIVDSLSPEARMMTSMSIDGTEQFLLRRTIPIATWSIVLMRPAQTVLASVTTSNWAMITLLVFIGFLSILSVLLAQRKILRPIEQLQAVQERITKGEVTARMDSYPKDELGNLIRSFNEMADSLLAANQKLVNKETALRESHQRLLDIADTLPGFVFQFFAQPDGAFGLHYIRGKTDILSSLPLPVDQVFDSFLESIHPEDKGLFLSSIQEAVDKVSPWRFTGRFFRPDGSPAWFNGMSIPQQHEKELIFNGVFLDVTEMKEAELSLKEKEQQLRGFIEQAMMAVCLTDNEGRVVEWNPTSEKLFNLHRDDVSGRYFWDIVKDLVLQDEHGQRYTQSIKRQILEALKTGHLDSQQVQVAKHRGSNGQTLYLEYFPFIIRREDSNSFALLLHDITERINTEQENNKRQWRILRHHEANLALNTDTKYIGETVEDALANTLRLVAEVMNVEQLEVWFFKDEGRLLECRASYRRSTDEIRSGITLETERYPKYIESIQNNRIMATDDVQTDERTQKLYEDYFKQEGITSFMDARIRLHGQLTGVFSVEHIGPKRTWALDELSFAGEVADHIERILGMEEQRKTETLRRIQERRLSLAFSASTDAIWEWNLETDETYFSPRWFTMLGYGDQEFPFNLETWKTLCHPDDLDRALDRTRQAVESDGKKPYWVEFRMRHAEGHWVWVLSRGDIVERNAEGAPLVFSGTHTDITKQKQTEETIRSSETWLRTILNSVADAVITADDLGRVTFLNPVAETLTGWSHHEALSRNIEEVLPIHYPGKPGEMLSYLRWFESLEGKATQGAMLHVRSRSRESFPALVTGAPMVDERDHLYGAVLLVRDITRQQQEEAQLRHQQKMESIGTLASGVAHEINNPIGIIMLYAERLQMEAPETGPVAEVAGEILSEGQRIADIVRNLLSFSRNERESHSPARMEDILRMTLSLVRKLIQKDQVSITQEMEPDLPGLKCRSQQIMQVLMNLILNAKDALNEKFTSSGMGEKTIRVMAKRVEKDGRFYVRTSVWDNGPGVPETVQHKIFDPFFTTKGRDRGTGLGLSVSHGIIRDHHGDLWLETKVGEYTVFHLDLPVDNGWSLSQGSAGKTT